MNGVRVDDKDYYMDCGSYLAIQSIIELEFKDIQDYEESINDHTSMGPTSS